jgi:tellurite resistance protein TerC
VLRATYLAIRRLLVFLVGTSVVLAGVVMIVTPGPAFIVIPAGLALLATEFLWARAVLLRLRRTIEDQVDRARNRRAGSGRGAAAGTTTPRD